MLDVNGGIGISPVKRNIASLHYLNQTIFTKSRERAYFFCSLAVTIVIDALFSRFVLPLYLFTPIS